MRDKTHNCSKQYPHRVVTVSRPDKSVNMTQEKRLSAAFLSLKLTFEGADAQSGASTKKSLEFGYEVIGKNRTVVTTIGIGMVIGLAAWIGYLVT